MSAVMWIIFFLGFKLTGHVMETLVTDVYDCGLRCLRNGKCRSYNSQADGNHGNMTCELSDQRRETRPEDTRRIKSELPQLKKELFKRSLLQ